MRRRIKHVGDVAAWRECLGCGACVVGCRRAAVSLVDVLDEGIRPWVDAGRCVGCGECLRVCPGYRTIHDTAGWPEGVIEELRMGWGPVLEVWEGHAEDDRLRYYGSSGGAASVLGLYCIERLGMEGMVHTGADPRLPWKSATVCSRSREEVLGRTGSRYAPASPCEGVEAVLGGLAPWVFIGKPCDVAGVRGVCGVRPDVAEGVGCRIAIFCAGTPSTRGTLGLLERVGMSPGQVRELRFRGRGWPGHLAVRAEGRQGLADTLGYEESWAFLQRFRPYRCHLCPDGTGELADIACGDPWCRTPRPGELGRSLVVVRTERGRQIVRGAIREGYVRLRRRPPRVLVDSQPGLYHKRAAVWGRVAAFRLCGLPAPRLGGFSLFANWRRRGVGEQARSVFGTVRRIVARGYLRRSTYLEGAVEAHGVPGVIRKSGIRIAQASSTASRARRWRGTGSPYLPQ